MTDPTRTTVARSEYARALKRLPVEARREIERIITNTPFIDESVLEEVKKIIDRHVAEGGEDAIKRFTPLLWQRGSDFAVAKLKQSGVEVMIPSLLGVVDEETLTHLENLQLDLVKGLSDDLKKQVAFQLREGLLKGESMRQLTERVKEVTRSARYKAERIARTETIRVFNTAAVDRYEKAGIQRWRWYAAMDERTCHICGPRHDKVFKMGDPAPPAHPGCRCAVVPEITPSGGRGKGEEKETGIVEDEKLDRGIRKTLAEFEKTLEKEEGNYLRAVNRIVNNGDPLMPIDSEKALKKIYRKHFSGVPKSLKEKMELSLLTRINRRVIEKAAKIKIVGKKIKRSYYNPLKKQISLVKYPDASGQWRSFLHEYGHHLEYEVFAEDMRKFYLARVRRHGYKQIRLADLEDFKGRVRSDEITYEGFSIEGLRDSPYAGKFYAPSFRKPEEIEDVIDRTHTEMVSIGLEYFRNEETIKAFYEGDREYFGFILHLMRGGTLEG